VKKMETKRIVKPWLWAIANPDGTPYMSEDCVCQDREPLDDQVQELNANAGLNLKNGYRVIALYRRADR